MSAIGVPKHPFSLETDARKEIRSRIETLERKAYGLRQQRLEMVDSLAELDVDIADHALLCASYEQVLNQQSQPASTQAVPE